MTTLARALAPQWDGMIRERGADYFRGGRVQIHSATARRIAAVVRGTNPYRVELARDGDDMRASCTCPYFDVALCKHVWAVVLAADAREWLHDDGRSAAARIVRVGIGEDELELAREPDGRSRRAKPVDWRKQLGGLVSPPGGHRPAPGDQPAARELSYVIDVAASRSGDRLVLEILTRELKKDGARGKARSRQLSEEEVARLTDPLDRQALAGLAGATPLYGRTFADSSVYHPSYYGSAYANAFGGGSGPRVLPARYQLLDAQLGLILPILCRTGRCRLRLEPEDEEEIWLPVQCEEGEPWQFRLEVRRDEGGERYQVLGALTRGSQRMALSTPVLLLGAGFLFTHERAARYEHHGAFECLRLLRRNGSIVVPMAQRDEFIAALLRQPQLPPLELPKELQYEEIAASPRVRLTVKPPRERWRADRLQGRLSFDYDGTVIAGDDTGRAIVQTTQRRVLLRDHVAERGARERLLALGWRPPAYSLSSGGDFLELPASRLPEVVRALAGEGWYVEAEGRVYRSPGRFDIGITTGIDWFELRGTVDFGETHARLPELLDAVRRGEKVVRLDDGTFGLLPGEWLRKHGLLAQMGTVQADHVRFSRAQVGLLDALLAAQPEARCDALFARARAELERFSGIEPADAPEGFHGELRHYQKEGLGWLHFLRDFGFGGCLADDMGLGKTVQVLALLETRRELRARRRSAADATVGSDDGRSGAPRGDVGPSLVIVPRSLIFNWKQEAERFTPRLRVLDHTGGQRIKGNRHFNEHDVVLTTYGTLRRDLVDLKGVRFDYVILDEAQAIKNADSASARAARLLQADHRLALSGTPIENHLGELWSLVEFLNPGMLGTASAFKLARAAERSPDEQTRKLIADAVRPILLRRTKEQVVPDLPPKVEQTLYCNLEGPQRRLYTDLRDHYRRALAKRIDREGIARSKIHILEALLRLRQAAIHPGLIDAARAREPSAKLDMLLPRLVEASEEGYKALVFSQFTTMLAILRESLDREGLPYEYLDGRTKNRGARVARFQTDPKCRLFLISLKAGGLGLNLTAAQYVFILDPWWNPAVEAQAIDRTHRIGQANRVFAYRLIARDTIEERVLELQNSKRDLADAIVRADGGFVRTLEREDLERLLS